jgi:hypothetical protein
VAGLRELLHYLALGLSRRFHLRFRFPTQSPITH